MRAVAVYRVDNVRKTRDPVGVIFEKRKTERGANFFDLLRLARRLFATDTTDVVHIMIGAGEARRTSFTTNVRIDARTTP